MLCLVKKGDSMALKFENAHRLKDAGGAALTLSSHPGFAVVPRYDWPRSAAEWRYVELGLGPAHMAMHAQMQDQFLVRLHDDRVMDIAHWRYEEGNTLNVLKSGHNHPGNTRWGHGGRSFIVNWDGTISPAKATHLVLGAQNPTLAFVQRSSPRKCVFEHNLSGEDRGFAVGSVPLTLSSHPGLAVVQNFNEPRTAFHEWQYKALGIGPASKAVRASRQSKCLVDGAGWYVTPSMLNIHDGNHLDVVRHMSNHPARLLEEHGKHGAKKPLDFNFNTDGTVSPVSQPHLCLGCSFDPLFLTPAQGGEGGVFEAIGGLVGGIFGGGAAPVPVKPAPPQPEYSPPPLQQAIPVVQAEVPVGIILPEQPSSSSSPMTLAQQAEVLKVQLGVEGTLKEVIVAAAQQLSIETEGVVLVELGNKCMAALGQTEDMM